MQIEPVPSWIPITEVDKLLNACSNRAAALSDLDDLIARGGVRVWATGVTSLYRNASGSSRQPSGPVQPATWETIRRGELNPAMWATGVVTLPASATTTGLVLKGIRIERGPFLRLLEEYSVAVAMLGATMHAAPEKQASPATQTANRARGGSTKWREWDRVWSSIVTLALDDRLNRAEFPSQAKLMEEVRTIQDGDELFSDRILKEFISKIYKEFVQPA